MYNPKEIESKWQKFWDENAVYKFDHQSGKPKYYCLVMFPYPSGKIHMGHVRNYVIGDVFARYYRLKNREVFHPIGWDSFGLPAENAAIKNEIHPKKWTDENIRHMKKQLKLLGISYDWSSEITTSSAEYYRWNQWFFLKMLERGMAYKRKSAVNWCHKCSTVLANEQVSNGFCWRCETEVEKKELEQWFIKITDYAQQLLDGHDEIKNGWPDEVIAMQKNWLGKSVGAEIVFKLEGNGLLESERELKIFTTRPDTLFGSTFVILSTEHPLSKQLSKNRREILDYINNSKKKTVAQKNALEKTGVFSGIYAVNPINREKIPVWIADYVTLDYGTGAIMCVPAHDQRDFEFAKKYNLPIREVISPPSTIEQQPNAAYKGEGIMINSGDFSGLDSKEGAKCIVEKLSILGAAQMATHWRLKDWLISRQRYWGTPIPVVYCDDCGMQPVKYEDLPVYLPEVVEITGAGDSPLASNPSFLNTICPKCSKSAKRETDTMDTFVDSSWYFARYCDSKNEQCPFDSEKASKLLPVDQYIGGIEHACMHLIYARFWQRFIKTSGMIKTEEPFQKLLTQGMVTLKGETMSKSKGNIVEPDSIIERYGADTLRIFILFAAPPANQLDWSDSGVEGAWRFLNRIWRLVDKFLEIKNSGKKISECGDASKLRKLTAKTIQKVTFDIEKEQQFNTAIASIMEFLNFLSSYDSIGDAPSENAIESLIILLLPFAPHFSSELEQRIHGSFDNIQRWPTFDEKLLKDDCYEIAVQINGKLRGRVVVPAEAEKEDALEIIKKDENLNKHINGKTLKNCFFVPKKLISVLIE